MDCCTSGLADVFTDDVSRKDADRYRRRGLPARAARLLSRIQSSATLQDKTTLEIGVGAGALTVEMLRRGARHATGIDAVPAQLANARALAADFGVADRAQFVLGEFPNVADVHRADVVVMDRVVCCYPDWQTLLGAAAAQADRLVALSYPRDAWWMHMTARVMNFWKAITRKEFRFYVHSPGALQNLLVTKGFAPHVSGRYFGWEILIAARADAPGKG